MKYQDLYSLKNHKKKHFKVLSAAVVIGTLRVNGHKMIMMICVFSHLFNSTVFPLH